MESLAWKLSASTSLVPTVRYTQGRLDTNVGADGCHVIPQIHTYDMTRRTQRQIRD